MTAVFLEESVDEFWASQDSTLAAPELSATEQQRAQELERQAQVATTLVAIAMVLGGGFLLYRSYAERQMRANLPAKPTSLTLQLLSHRVWKTFTPTWVKITAPAVANAYAMGVVDAKLGNVPPEILQVLAMQYATDMGDYFNQTSAQALTEGFNGFVNRKLPVRMAAERVIKAYGINPAQMRALISAENLGAMKITSIIETKTEAKTDRYIETQLVSRAHKIGDNEAFTSMRRGKQLSWMYQSQHGNIPKTATKVWVTAHDEKVCKYCGPMHQVEALVNEPFETQMGRVWVPALHPNCRCDIALKADVRQLVSIGKADWWREDDWEEHEHPRNRLGQFTFKPDTLVATKEETKEEEPQTWGTTTETWSGGETWDVPATLATPELETPKLESTTWQLPSSLKPETWAMPKLEAETETWALPQLSAAEEAQAKEQLAAIDEEVQAEAQAITEAIADIQAAPEAKVDTVPLTKTGTLSAYEMFRGQVYPTIEGKTFIEPGQEVSFSSGNIFQQTPDVEKEYDTLGNLTRELIADMTREVMSKQRAPRFEGPEDQISLVPPTGRPTLGERGIGIGGTEEEHGVAFTERRVAEIISAELLGDDRAADLRQIAQDQFGIHREDFAVVRTRVSEGHRGAIGRALDEEGSEIGMYLDGSFVVEEVKPMPEKGWPVITVFVAPKVKPEE